MSQENVQTVRREYEAFNRRDLAGAFDHFDPDFEWVPDGRDLAQAVSGREGAGKRAGLRLILRARKSGPSETKPPCEFRRMPNVARPSKP